MNLPTTPAEIQVTGGAPGLSLPQLNPDLSAQPNQEQQQHGVVTPNEEKKIIQPPPNLQPQSPPTFDQLANHVQSGIF